MTFLPIVDRELRTAARLTATYRNRTLMAGAVAAVAVVMVSVGSVLSVPSVAGRTSFATLSYLALIFCLLEGVRKTADCLSEEKREGTLGLLFLTDLKGYDVVLGKFVGKSLNSFYGLLSILPLLALPLLLGGVMPGEFWRMVLALTNILFFSLCMGMWISSLTRTERNAVGGTFFFVLAFMFIPLMTGVGQILPFSPFLAFKTSSASLYAFESQSYWWSIGITQIMCWLMLIGSSLVTPRSWQEKAVRPPVLRRRLPGNPARRALKRAEMLDANPAYWLAVRNGGPRVVLWLLALITGGLAVAFMSPGFAGGLVGLALFVNFLLKVAVASQAAQCIREAKRSNALEMLLSTPLSVREIIRGQVLALRRIFLAPIVLILGIEILAVALPVLLMANNAEEMLGRLVAIWGIGLVLLGIFILDIMAVVWAGMWFALSSRKDSQAGVKTILIVLVAPLFTLIFWVIGVPFFLAWPVFWMLWARSQVHTRFRELVTQSQAAVRRDPGWLPGVEFGVRATEAALPIPTRRYDNQQP